MGNCICQHELNDLIVLFTFKGAVVSLSEKVTSSADRDKECMERYRPGYLLGLARHYQQWATLSQLFSSKRNFLKQFRLGTTRLGRGTASGDLPSSNIFSLRFANFTGLLSLMAYFFRANEDRGHSSEGIIRTIQ